jgi:hypothetical protein
MKIGEISSSDSDDHEDACLLGCCSLWSNSTHTAWEQHPRKQPSCMKREYKKILTKYYELKGKIKFPPA